MKFFLTLTSLKYLVRKNKNESGLKKKLREKWKNHFGLNKKEFKELTKDIHNYQDNNDFKIIINKRTYDLKSAKKFLDGSNYT